MTSISTTFAHVTLGLPATADAHAISKGEVDAQITALIGSAPGVLDTLGEIASALNQDGNMYTSLSTMVTNSTSAASAALLTESNRAITAEALNRSDRVAAFALTDGAVSGEVVRAKAAEGVIDQRVTDVRRYLLDGQDALTARAIEEEGAREQAIIDEAKTRSDKDIELRTDVDRKAELSGATFTGDVRTLTYLYIGPQWRIAASGSDLEFQYSADGSTFSVGVPFISA
jgi:hypothetical protein